MDANLAGIVFPCPTTGRDVEFGTLVSVRLNLYPSLKYIDPQRRSDPVIVAEAVCGGHFHEFGPGQYVEEFEALEYPGRRMRPGDAPTAAWMATDRDIVEVVPADPSGLVARLTENLDAEYAALMAGATSGEAGEQAA